VAHALRDWLPLVLQEVEPWLASDMTQPGTQSNGIPDHFQDNAAIILCVTREALQSMWFHFGTGAAVRASPRKLIIPLAIGIEPSDITGPPAVFQPIKFDNEGIRKLVLRLNDALEKPLDRDVVMGIIDAWESPRAVFRDLSIFSKMPLLLADTDSDSPEPTLIDELRALTKEVSALHDRVEAGFRSAAVPPSVPEGKPRIFIGSSSEGLRVAESIQYGLDSEAECTVWTQDPHFYPSSTTIEGLVESSVSFDFAVIVMTADDSLTARGVTAPAPRDNLVFELGLFTGTLGRAKTFLVKCRDDDLKLPSDLKGVTTVEYGRRSDGNMRAAVGPVCLRIKEVLGVRRDPANPRAV
jgi:predicted nucleotide-binding protein